MLDTINSLRQQVVRSAGLLCINELETSSWAKCWRQHAQMAAGLPVVLAL